MLSHVQFFATLWTVAHQAPVSMGFCRQEYWSQLPFPSPRPSLTRDISVVAIGQQCCMGTSLCAEIFPFNSNLLTFFFFFFGADALYQHPTDHFYMDLQDIYQAGMKITV